MRFAPLRASRGVSEPQRCLNLTRHFRLLLGLLVSSAKGSYDTVRSEVIQMAAKITFLDRVLTVYGSEATDARARFRAAVEESVRRMWPEETHTRAQLGPNMQSGSAVVRAIQRLSPNDETLRSLKGQAMTLAVDIGQLHSLLEAQMVSPSRSRC